MGAAFFRVGFADCADCADAEVVELEADLAKALALAAISGGRFRETAGEGESESESVISITSPEVFLG